MMTFLLGMMDLTFPRTFFDDEGETFRAASPPELPERRHSSDPCPLCSAAGSSWGSSWGSSGLPFFSGGAHRAVVREQLLQRAREDVGVVVAEEDLEVASGRQVLAFGAA